jgi:hypothetical protein
MKTIEFQYRKTPENITDRKAIILTNPSNNYFTLDVTSLNAPDVNKLETGLQELQKNIDTAFTTRTKWLKDNGFSSCYRNFSKDKMTLVR